MIQFLGFEDGAMSTFTSYVLLNKPSKLKSVFLMEDLSEYDSPPAFTNITKDQALSCLKNVAVLHAKFWGNKYPEIIEKFNQSSMEANYRQARYSKIAAMSRKRSMSSSAAIKKKINSFYSGEWPKHDFMTFPKDFCSVPDWVTIQSNEEGRICIVEDEMIKETLNVMAKKLPKFDEKKLKNFIKKKECQTFLHGDFHGGNHMYGSDDSFKKVVAVDFQYAGKGLAVTDIVYFMGLSLEMKTYDEILELLKGNF